MKTASNNLFDRERILVGVVHLPPLPGSPGYKGSIDDVIEFTLEEAEKLQKHGFDAVILENFNDTPFPLRVTSPETIASMAVIVRKVSEALRIPVGVNILRNSGVEALAVAYAGSARFIRVNAYCETRVSPEGVLEPIARAVEEFRSKYNSGILVLADVDVKHSSPIEPDYNMLRAARECVKRGRPDALVVTGQFTGTPPPPGYVAALKGNGIRVPVLVGSGVTPDNIRVYWRIADGFIIGSYIKDRETGRLSLEKLRRMENIVKKLRSSVPPA